MIYYSTFQYYSSPVLFYSASHGRIQSRREREDFVVEIRLCEVRRSVHKLLGLGYLPLTDLETNPQFSKNLSYKYMNYLLPNHLLA